MVDTDKANAAFQQARDIALKLPEPAATLLTHVNNRNVSALGPLLEPHIALEADPAASPERAPAPPAAPVFLLHGSDDIVIPAAESVVLANHLRQQGVDVRLLLSQIITHAELDRAAAISDSSRLIAFWAEVLQEITCRSYFYVLASRFVFRFGSGFRVRGSGSGSWFMQRLQKVLAQAGIASRRAAETLIAEGRVSVNGSVVREMGTKADAGVDDIRVDGRRIKAPQTLRYILLHKPAGYVSTRADPQRRPTVLDLLQGVREYIYPVGRLDYDSEGLLLLTNDGELAATLTHPRHGVERTYEAQVTGMPDAEALERLRKGIPLDGRRTLPADVAVLNRGRGDRHVVLVITIREGRNRQVRRMCEAVGHPVRTLTRTRIGPLEDRRLKPGRWRELTPQEIRTLKTLAARPLAARPRRAARAPRAARAR